MNETSFSNFDSNFSTTKYKKQQTEKLLLSNDIKDYYFVSQGKTVIEGVDDKAEMLITDVRLLLLCFFAKKNFEFFHFEIRLFCFLIYYPFFVFLSLSLESLTLCFLFSQKI